MNKKIKVIDILNKIVNKEDVPKYIKCLGKIYQIQLMSSDYLCLTEKLYLTELTNAYPLDRFLDFEVEILEDEKETYIKQLDPNSTYFKDGTELVYKVMYDKINELVEKVNKIDNKTNKED